MVMRRRIKVWINNMRGNVTPSEAKLLNEINIHHCDFQFGKVPFNENGKLVSVSRMVSNILLRCYFSDNWLKVNADTTIIFKWKKRKKI